MVGQWVEKGGGSVGAITRKQPKRGGGSSGHRSLDYHGTTVATTANKRRCALQIWVQAIINY